jgi:hypothetical protein
MFERPVSSDWYTGQMLSHVPVPLASQGAPADAIGILGLLAVSAWITWRFGATLLRLTGFCSWCVGWACGSQGGYGYCLAFLALGILAWGAGTVWYAKRRGRWPSAISARLLTRVLDRRSPLTPTEAPNDSAVVPLRRS